MTKPDDTEIDYDHAIRLCEAATPGGRVVNETEFFFCVDTPRGTAIANIGKEFENPEADVAFIAYFSPTRTKALLERARESEKENDTLLAENMDLQRQINEWADGHRKPML